MMAKSVKKAKDTKVLKETPPKLSDEQKVSGQPTKFGQVVKPHYGQTKPKFGNPND